MRANRDSEKREIRTEILKEVSDTISDRLKKNRVDANEFINQ